MLMFVKGARINRYFLATPSVMPKLAFQHPEKMKPVIIS